MGVKSTVSCDCCKKKIETSGVQHAISVMRLNDGAVRQDMYGIACGCAAAIQAAIDIEVAKCPDHTATQ